MKKRTQSRLAAVQAIYQLEKSRVPLQSILQEFMLYRFKEIGSKKKGSSEDLDKTFFKDLCEQVSQHLHEVDTLIGDNLAPGWTLPRMDQVTHAVLRCAATELLTLGETPTKVIINEYLEVAHTFFDENEVKFINKTLDSIAKIVRVDISSN